MLEIYKKHFTLYNGKVMNKKVILENLNFFNLKGVNKSRLVLRLKTCGLCQFLRKTCKIQQLFGRNC